MVASKPIISPAASTAALLFHGHHRPPPNPHVILREISPHLGRGWFAQEDLPAGTILWREHPRAVASSRKDLIQLVQENAPEFQHLCYYDEDNNDTRSNDDENESYSCCCGSSNNKSNPKKKMAEGIVRCNHFAAAPDLMLLFDDISLLNHSCNPNASVVMRDDESNRHSGSLDCRKEDSLGGVQGLVQTARQIAAGDEINISYSDEALFWPWRQRHEYMQSRWGFDCACERCQFQKEQSHGMDEERVDEGAGANLNNDSSSSSSSPSYVVKNIWPLLEQAAAVSKRAKPRAKVVDPVCRMLQQQAADAVSKHMPYLKQGDRFKADVKYFS